MYLYRDTKAKWNKSSSISSMSITISIGNSIIDNNYDNCNNDNNGNNNNNSNNDDNKIRRKEEDDAGEEIDVV